MLDAIKPLLDSELINEETRSAISEAWEAKLTEAREQVRHYLNNGATCPILYPLGDVHAMIDAFADWDGK